MEAARREAVLGAREMLAEWILHEIEHVPKKILITDEDMKVLAVVHILDVLPRALR